MKSKLISIDIYRASVLLCCECEEEEALELYKKKLKRKDELELKAQGRTKGSCIRLDGEKDVLIWIENPPDSSNTVAILVHECIHAAYEILEASGIPTSYDHQECVTYLADLIVSKSLYFLYK
jgi:hypothetical protein